ncbi:histidine kinase [Stutzerimonas stutzeri TS44]|nr:histidine kinase [Stutzerimonas stutzeri TS44]
MVLDPFPAPTAGDRRSGALALLVVDDYPPGLMLLKQQFSFFGHRVVAATDGKAAFDEWLADDFDAVLTDSRMPVMDGCQLAGAIRRHEQASGRSPCLIIGITANAVPEERERCLAAGMDECFFKPIDLVELERYLNQYAAGAPVQISTETTPLDTLDARLWALAGQQKDARQTLVSALRSNNQADCERLQELLAAQDTEGLADFAHRIRGAAGLIGAESLTGCCLALEQACATGESADALWRRAEILLREVQALSADLDRLQ